MVIADKRQSDGGNFVISRNRSDANRLQMGGAYIPESMPLNAAQLEKDEPKHHYGEAKFDGTAERPRLLLTFKCAVTRASAGIGPAKQDK